MVWLSDSEKLENMFTRFNTIHKRDGQQDGQTDGQTDTARRHRPCLCIALRGKNRISAMFVQVPASCLR